MDTNDTKIEMTTTEHGWVWDSLNATIKNHAKAADEMSKLMAIDPRNAMDAIGRMGPFVKTCWDANIAKEIQFATPAIMKRESISAEDALEKALDYAVKQTKDLLLDNRLAATSTSQASNAVDHYKAEAASQWLRGIGSYTRQLGRAKKAE
jgi:hypothetical protein